VPNTGLPRIAITVANIERKINLITKSKNNLNVDY
jgi:hypothetical protein